jgi:hypothetical protein
MTMTGRQQYAVGMAALAGCYAALTAEAIRDPRVSIELRWRWMMWGTHVALVGGLAGGAAVWAWRGLHR